MRIVNQTRGENLAWRARIATKAADLRRGLLDRRSITNGEALMLWPCRAVTMVGMKFPIDVVFLDRAGNVTELFPDLNPGEQVAAFSKETYGAIELPTGAIRATGTCIGDELFVWGATESGAHVGRRAQPKMQF